MATMPPSDPLHPVKPDDRLQSADAVRGFALFGVLLVNMFNFGAYSSEWTDTLDQAFNAAMHAVFETKSWRLFAMLFGFGFALQLAKLHSVGDGNLWFYFRRVTILFGIGMGHALFFDGDILMEYALLGFILPAFRRLRAGTLLALTLLLMFAFPVGNVIDSLRGASAPIDADASLSLAELRDDHPYLGTVGDVFKTNAEVIPPRLWNGLNEPESSLAIFAMILLGFQIGRSRLVHDAAKHTKQWCRMLRWGMTTGLAFAALEWYLSRYHGYAAFEGNTASIEIRFLGDVLFLFGSTALALAYAAGIVLLAQHSEWSAILSPLQSLGRMALTVYLSGTLMFTLLFYGYGFGQLYLLGPVATTACAALFFAVQIIFCSWWLRFFRFGPVEWIWRCLTYLQTQPLRIPA
jgi:uncharacterized protein